MERPDRYFDAGRSSYRDDRSALLREYHRTRDGAVRERLVELYLPLVHAIARRYANRGERLEDLVQVGSIGLIEAIDRFDPERGCNFAAFAVPTVTGEIQNHLRDKSAAIRVPRRLAELTLSLRPPRERLAARLCRSPTLSELAQEAGVREVEVAEAIQTELARRPLSLSLADGSDEELNGAIVLEDAYDSSEDRLLLAAGFRTLGDRERRILHLRFFAGCSQAEIAREVGLSQIQVSRLIQTSLERMRAALDGNRQRAAPRESPIGA